MRRALYSDLRKLTVRARGARPCPRSGKVRYETEALARKALERVTVEQAWGNRRRHEKYVYPCLACGGWHLTSEDQEARR